MTNVGIEPVRVAVIGCGAVTQELHSPSLTALEGRGDLRVTVVSDPNPEARSNVARRFPTARVEVDLRALRDWDCEAVLLATPARLHAGQAVECLEAGLHVLCEKPMASSTGEAERMIEAARNSGRLLAVGYVRRFFPATQWIREVIVSGRFGKVLGFVAIEGGTFAWPAKSASFFDRSQSGGGVLIDNGIHALDLLTWWMGEPRTVELEEDSIGGVEINARVRLDHGTFAGTLQLSWDSPTPNAYRIEFEEAWIRWQPYSPDRIELGFPGMKHGLRSLVVGVGPDGLENPTSKETFRYHDAFPLEWLNFVAAIRGREPLRVPGEEGMRSLALVEACYRRSSYLTPPWFTEAEVAEARRRREEVSP